MLAALPFGTNQVTITSLGSGRPSILLRLSKEVELSAAHDCISSADGESCVGGMTSKSCNGLL